MADNCSELSAQIAALSAEIGRLNILSEAQVKAIAQQVVSANKPDFVQTTRSAIQPDISSAIAAGLAVVYSRLEPKISNAQNTATKADAEATSAYSRATIADLTAQKASLDADIASFKAAAAEGKATEAQLKAIAAY
ncbi:MAG: hypothetical protein ACYTX0_46290, partial [Nostoc sp.]